MRLITLRVSAYEPFGHSSRGASEVLAAPVVGRRREAPPLPEGCGEEHLALPTDGQIANELYSARRSNHDLQALRTEERPPLRR
jgi:hypothetical protein